MGKTETVKFLGHNWFKVTFPNKVLYGIAFGRDQYSVRRNKTTWQWEATKFDHQTRTWQPLPFSVSISWQDAAQTVLAQRAGVISAWSV